MIDKPRGRRATVKDVAEAAGVSAMTVSNVLNGRLQFVSPATRKRVEREIARLGYRRQAHARNLRVAAPRSIGMVIIDRQPGFLADFFTGQVVAGLANILNGADYTLTIQGMTGAALPDSGIMRSFEVAGYCAMFSGPPEVRHDAARRLAALDQPLVLLQEGFELPGADLAIIRQDDRGGGRLIADHLLARRATRILAVVPTEPWPAIEQRLAGLADGIAAFGSDARLTVVRAESESFADVQAALARHLDANPMPDAVFGGNDPIATAALFLLLDRGIAVPDRVRVVGFNGFEAHRHARPRLTTVASAAYALGETAGRAMLHRLAAGAFERREWVLPVHLEAGTTT